MNAEDSERLRQENCQEERMKELGIMYRNLKDDEILLSFISLLPESQQHAFSVLVSVFVDNNPFLPPLEDE